MSFNDCKISESEIQTTGVQAQADTLTGSAADNKLVFDALPTLVIQKLNSLIDQMQQMSAAGQIGVTPFDGMTAQTLQDALEQIQADIGGNYGGADGAGKVGYTPSEGVDEDTVQEAIEAVQANLTAYIAKIKAATGAAEVGSAPIAGMTATNVQQALEELRENIDNIVSGIIPGGSITSDMLQDGAVTEAKLSSDVAAKLGVLGGATTPQGALANLGAGVRPNLLINPFFEVNQRGQTSYSGGASYFIDLWKLSNSAMSVQISDDHISITSASTYQSFEQRIENYKELFGKTLTLSALVKGVSGNTVGIAIGNTNTSTGVYFRERFTCTGNWQLITMTFTLSEISSGDTYLAVMCYPEFTNGGTGGTSDWMAAKLEEGSTQTLAYQDDTGAWQLLPQPESDYATQLARCQRYYQIYSTADARPSKAVDCRPVMRTDPAQGTIVVGDTTYYYNTAEL